MFKRLLELLLDLPKDFLHSPKEELGWHFDPHWPGPLIGAAGTSPNYLIGITAIVLLVILARKTSTREFHNLRLGLAAGSTVLAAFLMPASMGMHWWTVLLLVGMIAAAAIFFFRKIEVGVMAMGRVSLVLMLLMALSGARAWNLTLGIGGLLLVYYVYRREGRSNGARIFLGTLRAALIAFVMVLLNNPILTRTQTLIEPSVVAVMVDDSLSMRVRDVNVGPASSGPMRLESAVDLLTGDDQSLIRKLSQVHSLRFYSFDRNARQVGAVAGADERKKKQDAQAPSAVDAGLVDALKKLLPEGPSTQVVPSIITVLDDLQGQRVAGIVILTDGRDTPSASLPDAYKALAGHGVKVYPIAVGSDKVPQNIEVQSVSVQDSAFKDDIVNLRLSVRASGYEPGHAVKLKLTEKKTGLALRDPDGKPVEKIIHPADSNPIEEELLFKPSQIGPLDIKVEAEKQPGELDEQDNVRLAQVSVLDARIVVLYVEGYPRWEYRYIKNEMIRDKTVDMSCVLTSADPTFAQEHTTQEQLRARGEGDKFKYFPFSQFPPSMEQLMECDVVLFGDVDPRQFADSQLQMIADFVNKKGGGFGMIAGPTWSPAAYRNTPIEALLPVTVVRNEAGWPSDPITEGFRPAITKEGAASSIFRFFPDRAANEKYIKEQLQQMFWYSRGISAKPGVGLVYAEHPSDLGPDGRKAPLLVLGRSGSGRTMFSAMDDTWRWRYYTGENVFDSYWVQQLRYLARSKKLGQRDITFNTERPTYQLGEQIRVNLRVLNPTLLQQLPPEIVVQVKDENGQLQRSENLQKEPGQPDYYTASFGADRAGHYTLTLPPDKIPDVSRLDLSLDVIVPRLELAEPQVDQSLLSRLAAETAGQQVKLEEARAKLPDLIQSAARTIPLIYSKPLWDKPLALCIFMLLLTTEWVLRKVYGMV